MVQFFFPVIAVLSFGPALLLLYISLSRYTWPRTDKPYFDDRWIFGLLAVGIIVGAVFAYIEELTAVGGGIVFVVLFVAIQQLLVLVILNYPRVRRKGSGRFYGYSLGTSMAAGVALGEYGIVFSGAASFNIPTLLVLVVYTFGIELLGGATGSIIGYGIESGTASRGTAYAILLQAVFNVIMIPVFSFRPSALTMLFDISALAVSVAVYLAVLTRLLPRELIAPGAARSKRLM